MADILYIVIPCFNEEEVLTETTKRLTEKMRKMMESGKIADSSRIDRQHLASYRQTVYGQWVGDRHKAFKE